MNETVQSKDIAIIPHYAANQPDRLPIHILLWHWGREGAGAKFTYELARHLRVLFAPRLTLSSASKSDLCRMTKALDLIDKEIFSTFEGDKRRWLGKLAATFGLVRIPLLAQQFHRMLVRRQTQVALCTFQSIWDIATLPALMLGSVRSVLILHDAFFHPGDGYPLRHFALRWQVRQTDGLIVLSEHVRRQAITAFDYPDDRIWKMPHAAFAFGSEHIRPAVHPRGARPVRLLFFGRIVVYKGLDRLLLAHRLLLKWGLSVELTIAGSGNLQPYASLLEDAPHVETHNRWLNEDEIAAFLAAADIIILPYTEASQSGVAAASYAAGRPVVATPVGGLIEQVHAGETGLLASELSVESLAEAIAKFVLDPALLDHCGVGALKHASHELDWHKMAQTVADVISTVQSTPRRRKSRCKP